MTLQSWVFSRAWRLKKLLPMPLGMQHNRRQQLTLLLRILLLGLEPLQLLLELEPLLLLLGCPLQTHTNGSWDEHHLLLKLLTGHLSLVHQLTQRNCQPLVWRLNLNELLRQQLIMLFGRCTYQSWGVNLTHQGCNTLLTVLALKLTPMNLESSGEWQRRKSTPMQPGTLALRQVLRQALVLSSLSPGQQHQGK